MTIDSKFVFGIAIGFFLSAVIALAFLGGCVAVGELERQAHLKTQTVEAQPAPTRMVPPAMPGFPELQPTPEPDPHF